MPSPYTVDYVRQLSQQDRHHLRRRPRSGVDAEDPRRPEAEGREGHVLPDWHRGREVSRGVTKRIYSEGHEIGNHTFTHPDISNISKRYFEVELNLTESLFESKLGVKPVLFRPPYSIDQEPDTADQVRPLELSQDMGFITVGDKIDPNDWRDNPRRTADEIVPMM